jgi:hypothetical protein
MMVAGSIDGSGEWNEAQSLARSIETSMVADGILSLEEETQDAMKQRRKSMIALARGIVTHLAANATVSVPVAAGAINPGVPSAARNLSGTVS